MKYVLTYQSMLNSGPLAQEHVDAQAGQPAASAAGGQP